MGAEVSMFGKAEDAIMVRQMTVGELMKIRDEAYERGLKDGAERLIERPIDTEQAATFLNRSERTIRNLVNKKIIPGYKKGKEHYFYRSELNAYIKTKKKS